MTTPDPPARRATAAYHAAVADGPFDHQRDAYEQGYEDGGAAERERIRRFAATLNSHNPDDSDVLALIREFETAAATAERQRIVDAIRRNMTGTPLSSWATGWRDCAAWIEQDMPGAGLPVGADARDSDTQPDPYIDTIAAQHGQEFEPDDQDDDDG